MIREPTPAGIYGPDRAALRGDDVVLLGNRENATIDSQSVTWYFENGKLSAKQKLHSL